MTKETQKQIEELQTAIGAACEIAGEMKRHLLENGFTHLEALHLVDSFLNGLFHQKREDSADD